MRYYVGQAFGILAAVACVLSPMFKKKWQMLLFNILANLCLALNLVFIDQIGSGIFLFAVAIIQGILSMVHDFRKTEVKLPEKIIFLILYLVLGFYGLTHAPGYVPGINGQNLLELLPIFGSVMSMCFIFVKDERVARRFLLANVSTWAVYTGIIGSTSFLAELFSVASTLTAMYKYRKNRKDPADGTKV